MGSGDYGIDPEVISRVAAEIKSITDLGVQLGVVIGGGNIFRGGRTGGQWHGSCHR